MKRRILYADDDETSRLSIARLLEQEGYECVAAADGVVGGHFLREQEFDCVISDLNMLGNANMEFLAAVPKLQPGVPLIIVTGYPSIESATAAFQLPVVAYLTKPLDFDELLKQVHEASFRRLVLQEFNATRSNLEKWRADLGDLARTLKESPRVALGVSMDAYLTVTYRNVLAALLGLKTVMEHSLSSQAEPEKRNMPLVMPVMMVEALRDTIMVLEKTKDSFRSRELGDLRRRLEDLLPPSRERKLGSPE